jgi:hypothetical protein
MRHRGAKRHRKKHQPGTLEELSKSIEILRGGHDACHDRPKQKKGDIGPETHEMPPAFLDLIYPHHPQTNANRSQHPRRCDNTIHTIQTKTHKKHDKRKSEAKKIRHRTGQTTQNHPTPTRTSIQPPRWQLKRTHTNNNTTLTAPPLSLSQPTYKHKCERRKGAVRRGQNKTRLTTQIKDLDNTQTKTKNRHKNKQTRTSANLTKKDTKRDTSMRDLYGQLETLVQDHIENQLKHRHNGQLPYKRFSRRPSNTNLHILERHKRVEFSV